MGTKHSYFLKKICCNNLVIADFKHFSEKIKQIFEEVKKETGGKNAD